MSPGLSSRQETTPLLHSELDLPIYHRFSDRQKSTILSLVSWCGFMSLFVPGVFVPSIPQIAKDFDTTGSTVSLAISSSIFATSVGGLAGSAYSTTYGRRVVYLSMLPFLCIGSLGATLSTNIPQLVTWRFVQGLGISPGLSIGAAVIGDIYPVEERGQAMGMFFAASVLGPALAPPIGGFFTQYQSWRLLQVGLGAIGCLTILSIWIFLPESSQPSSRPNDNSTQDHSKPIFINPLQPLSLLQSPNIFLVSFLGFLLFLTEYVFLTPFAYTIGSRYNITSAAVLGACFLPAGLGNMTGAPISGALSDRVVVKWRTRRNGIWCPEDRLRAAIPGALLLIPLPLICSALLTTFVPGTVGLILNLICLFVHGIGMDIALGPPASYIVDIMHSRSAEAIAAMASLRSLFLSISVCYIFPFVENFGLFATNLIAALLSWVACFILWSMIHRGQKNVIITVDGELDE